MTTFDFDQVIPKPFCESGPYDYVYVNGPVYLHQISTMSADGVYETHFTAKAELAVFDYNPMTGQIEGTPITAVITETHNSWYGDARNWASMYKHQALLPVN